MDSRNFRTKTSVFESPNPGGRIQRLPVFTFGESSTVRAGYRSRIIHQYRRPAQVNAYCAGTSVASRCSFRHSTLHPSLRLRAFAFNQSTCVACLFLNAKTQRTARQITERYGCSRARQSSVFHGDSQSLTTLATALISRAVLSHFLGRCFDDELVDFITLVNCCLIQEICRQSFGPMSVWASIVPVFELIVRIASQP
jgi:hypothetical protein